MPGLGTDVEVDFRLAQRHTARSSLATAPERSDVSRGFGYRTVCEYLTFPSPHRSRTNERLLALTTLAGGCSVELGDPYGREKLARTNHLPCYTPISITFDSAS